MAENQGNHMAQASHRKQLGALLEDLKQRSGHSYQWIGQSVRASKSTVYRYCTGQIVPPDFATVERIAKACNAGRAEMAALHQLWMAASAGPEDVPADARDEAWSDARGEVPPAGQDELPSAAAEETPDGLPDEACDDVPEAVSDGLPDDGGDDRPERPEEAERPGVPVSTGPGAAAGPGVPAGVPAGTNSPTAGPTNRVPRQRRRSLLLVLSAALMTLVVAVTATGSSPADRDSSSGSARQWIPGPAWVSAPAPVPSTLFGVTLNSTTGTMPSFRTGAVRLWDSDTRWSNIQPRRGEFDWSILDRLVDGAERARLPALFVMGGTPRWASPDGPVGPYADGSRAAPPDRLADWDTYVRALVERYEGRIEAYELWVLANDPRFYDGSVRTLVEMVRRAARTIRAVDPDATVVCPGMGRLWDPEAVRVFERFAELGGYRHCDVAGVKLYQRTASDPPETMLALTRTVDRILHHAGVHPRLWNTGTMYEIPLQKPLGRRRAADYAVRFYLVGLYARNANVERMYFYNWGGTKIPIVLQAEGGAPTQAALAVERLQRWLAHARIHSCGHGLASGLGDNVWECRFTVTGSRLRHEAAIRWTDSGTAVTTSAPDLAAVHRLDGTVTPVRPGDTIRITEQPILLEEHPRSLRPVRREPSSADG
ncbi:helix-turn-helix domain-containing protein [Streptomyces scabiei]|nr:helix-turn-helix domain-containing protein [Streptomyces scabiei]MDX2574799.1 helix-turn-helix domain-containing protein [Streptomyces scabiei]MDX2651587.1 helix-turn-helix domain-containing protein [Streptomyces scabiei]MDX2722882.1 helix-turn-helix domain-containing protein [Streptomyces scabiei]MDX2865993.1 helix-turn-helix domain-containing protein [Streptomyces scabiei]MDX2884843.1 helix-turn-helix domain-containing protein [Streptomyces scabiei]